MAEYVVIGGSRKNPAIDMINKSSQHINGSAGV